VAKGETATTNRQQDAQTGRATNFQQNYQNELLDTAHNAQNQNAAERTSIMQGYQNMADTGGINQADIDRLRGLYNAPQNPTWQNYDALPADWVNSGAGAGGGGGYQAPSYTYSDNIGGVQSSYEDLMNGGGVNRYSLGTLNDLAGRNAGWSQENIDRMNRGISGYESIAGSGGFSDASQSNIRNDIANVRAAGTLDPAMMARFNQGLSGYSDLATTGGWSDQTKADYMAKATGVIPAMYEQANQDAQRQSTVQGGINPGLSYALRNNMASQAAAASAAAREGRLGMENSILANKTAGYAGLTANGLSGANAMNDAAVRAASTAGGMEQGFEQALTNNRLAGLGGATSNTMGWQNSQNDTRLGAANSLNTLTGIDLQAKLAGTSGLNGVIAARAQEAANAAAAAGAASSASAANAAARERYMLEYNAARVDNMNRGGQQGFTNQMAQAGQGLETEQGILGQSAANRLAGLGGMAGMYGTAPGYQQAATGNVLANQGQGNNAIQSGINSRYQANPTGSGGFMGGLNALANAAGAVTGGVTGLGSLIPRTNTNTGAASGYGAWGGW
jgi:hypothetical protein